ncbi:hypothetical protein [Streptococcus halichoeri]|uniref:hypothetical protein n=1 Tax=Streptococcus halichoeri TaxID=254785 RepID=UPI001356BBE9|nr:hypothetical protein [Streptococcus halichoeri]
MRDKVLLFIVATTVVSISAVTSNPQTVSATEVCTYVNGNYGIGVCHDDGKETSGQSTQENSTSTSSGSNWFYNLFRTIWQTIKKWFA